MKIFKVFAIAMCLFVVGAILLPSAKADDWDKKTTITFSGPVEVPGVGQHLLPAGTYLFKLVDSASNRHIVRIFSEDGLHVYTTILAINNYRLQATDKTVMTFRERPVGQPEALKAWFYPGDNFGQEFVYAKSRAIELAKVVNEPVLATPVELDAVPIEALKTVPVVAVEPTGDEVEVAKVVEPAPAESQPLVAANLPQTASPLPLLALFGLLSLGGGFVASRFSKRSA